MQDFFVSSWRYQDFRYLYQIKVKKKKLSSQAHSCFTTVVDGTEFSPVYPFQMKPFKYEDHEDEGSTGAQIADMTDFGINIHIRFFYVSRMCAFRCDMWSLVDSPASWTSNSDRFVFFKAQI